MVSGCPFFLNMNKTACRAFGAAAVLFCSPLRGSLSKNDVRGFAAHYSGKGFFFPIRESLTSFFYYKKSFREKKIEHVE